MKRIGITQRVVFVEQIKERRDVLDQRWYNFAFALGVMLIPIPNVLTEPSRYVDELEIDCLIFSGGNNLGFHGKEVIDQKSIQEDDVAYERDKTEIELIEWATNEEKPIMGICRGMQVLNSYFGGSLNKVNAKNHVAKEHSLDFDVDELLMYYSEEPIVNSYHDWGIRLDGLAKSLIPLATFGKMEVEALKHKEKPFIGIMWHPERYSKFRNSDLSFFKKVFQLY